MGWIAHERYRPTKLLFNLLMFVVSRSNSRDVILVFETNFLFWSSPSWSLKKKEKNIQQKASYYTPRINSARLSTAPCTRLPMSCNANKTDNTVQN